MVVRQRVTTSDAGRPVLVKRATTEADVERLMREAAMLRAAAHPGVVESVGERRLDDGGFELTLAVAGSRTVADLRTDLACLAGVVVALAATVADLHDLGIVHGRIRAEHVVIDGSSRPVLCGFAEAVSSGSLSWQSAPTPADDVAGLGALLRDLVAPAPMSGLPDWEPVPERRFRWRRDRWSGLARRSLLTLADQATADDPARRPTARALAASILAAVPEARLPGAVPADARERPTPEPLPPNVSAAIAQPPWSRLRGLTTPIGAAVGLGLLVFGIGGLLRPPPSARSAPAGAAPAVSAPSELSRPLEGPSSTSTTSSTSTPTSTTSATSTTTAVHVRAGELVVDGVRYGVGLPGDLVTVGDWDCDGLATAALVRPGSGEVFLFDSWPSEAAAATVEAITVVPGARAIDVNQPDGDGCPSLVVTADDGARTEVPGSRSITAEVHP